MWSSRRCPPAPLAGSLSSSSRPATRECSFGCRFACCVTSLLISHIMLLHRSLRLTRMKSCVRRYSSCLNFFGEIFYNKLINTVQVNENLNNPPAPGSARAGGGSGGGLPGGLPAGLDFNNLGDSELQNLLNNMSQQQLMQV